MGGDQTLCTWDGKPISQEPPYGAAIVVYRETGGRIEFLVLHRTHASPDAAGEWAWTPPSGARYPGESIAACAARELREETGLDLASRRIDRGGSEWALFLAQASADANVRTSVEHDRYAWLELEEAAKSCTPQQVGEAFFVAGRELGLR